MKLFKKAKKGFTLVELVVVIAVIAILAAVSVGAYFGVTESAKASQIEQEAKAVHTSITLVVSNPKNGLSMDKTGLDFGEVELVGTADGTFETLIEAVSGVDYNFRVHTDTNEQAPTAFPTIEFDNGDKATEYTYWIDASHKATFDIVTGAKVADALQHA